MTLHGRVTRVNMERLQLDLTCRSSDLADKEGKFRYITGHFFYHLGEYVFKTFTRVQFV